VTTAAKMLVVLAVGWMLWPQTSAAAPSSTDRRATNAYLQANYAFYRTAVANIPASEASSAAIAAKLENECPGVMANAPSPPTLSSTSPPTPAAIHQVEQVATLNLELLYALARTALAPDDGAVTTLVQALRPLKWSGTRLTRQVRAKSTELEGELSITIPDVCADMKAWVASGYRALSPSTSEFVHEIEAESTSSDPEAAIDATFVRQEDHAEKALAARTRRLRGQVDQLVDTIVLRLEAIRTALGLKALDLPPANPEVVIGHGRTAAGGTFVASVEPASKGCQPILTITETRGAVHAIRGNLGPCGPASKNSAQQTVECDEGLLAIEARMLTGARRARLLLSNGRKISSPVLILPADHGGPAGFYYQVVRGPTPIPVSLTELDARGRTLRVLKLAKVRGCTKQARA
jgi:hypothetical protein